jgi:hypothetical protein
MWTARNADKTCSGPHGPHGPYEHREITGRFLVRTENFQSWRFAQNHVAHMDHVDHQAKSMGCAVHTTGAMWTSMWTRRFAQGQMVTTRRVRE